MLSRPQVLSAALRIMSMKNSDDTIGNGTRDLPASTNCATATFQLSVSVYNNLLTNSSAPHFVLRTQSLVSVPTHFYVCRHLLQEAAVQPQFLHNISSDFEHLLASVKRTWIFVTNASVQIH